MNSSKGSRTRQPSFANVAASRMTDQATAGNNAQGVAKEKHTTLKTLVKEENDIVSTDEEDEEDEEEEEVFNPGRLAATKRGSLHATPDEGEIPKAKRPRLSKETSFDIDKVVAAIKSHRKDGRFSVGLDSSSRAIPPTVKCASCANTEKLQKTVEDIRDSVRMSSESLTEMRKDFKSHQREMRKFMSAISGVDFNESENSEDDTDSEA